MVAFQLKQNLTEECVRKILNDSGYLVKLNNYIEDDEKIGHFVLDFASYFRGSNVMYFVIYKK